VSSIGDKKTEVQLVLVVHKLVETGELTTVTYTGEQYKKIIQDSVHDGIRQVADALARDNRNVPHSPPCVGTICARPECRLARADSKSGRR
jgi:hypothetical protein